MKFSPFTSPTFHSPYSLEETRAKLLAASEQETPTTKMTGGEKGHVLIKANGEYIRVTMYKGSVGSSIGASSTMTSHSFYGKFYPENNGTRIEGTFRFVTSSFYFWQITFLLFFFGFLALALYYFSHYFLLDEINLVPFLLTPMIILSALQLMRSNPKRGEKSMASISHLIQKSIS